MNEKIICRVLNGKVCLNTPTLAEILCIEQRTLQEWATRGCPKAARGWWSIKDVLAWRGLVAADGVKTEGQAEAITLSQKKMAAEVRLKAEKADEAEFKNAIARGEYIPRDEVTSTLKRFFVVLKRSMLGYSRRIATEVSPYVDSITARRIEKMITDLTLDALEQISIDGTYQAPKVKRKN